MARQPKNEQAAALVFNRERVRPTDEELDALCTPEYLAAHADEAIAAWDADGGPGCEFRGLLEAEGE